MAAAVFLRLMRCLLVDAWFLRDPRIEWFDDPDVARARLLAVLNGPDGFVRD